MLSGLWGLVVLNGCSGWDLSSLEAFGSSHVSLEELEKQVCNSWPVNRPCLGLQASRISWAMQCCHLLPAGGHRCVQGTRPVPGAGGHHTGQGLVELSLVQMHPGTHLPQSASSLFGCCTKKDDQQSAFGIFFLVWVIFNMHSVMGRAGIGMGEFKGGSLQAMWEGLRHRLEDSREMVELSQHKLG